MPLVGGSVRISEVLRMQQNIVNKADLIYKDTQSHSTASVVSSQVNNAHINDELFQDFLFVGGRRDPGCGGIRGSLASP